MTCNTETCTNEATHKNKLTTDLTCTECMESSIDARFYDVADFEAIETEPSADDVETQLIKDQIELGESFELKKPDGTSERINPDDITTPTETTDLLKTNNITALTILEASLAEDLIKIKEDVATLPALAKTDEQYDQVYEFSTRLKRFSVAVRKKEKLLQKGLKTDFKTGKEDINDQLVKIKTDYGKSKTAIESQLETIMNTVTPLIKKTVESRDYLECWKLGLKMNAARTLAGEQKKERIRIAAEKSKIKTDKKTDQNKKAEDIKLAQEKLDRERYEFECEKSRLSVDDAWEDAHAEPSRDHEECAYCADEKSGPSNCPDHPQGPISCHFFKDAEKIKLAEKNKADDRPGVSHEKLDEILDKTDLDDVGITQNPQPLDDPHSHESEPAPAITAPVYEPDKFIVINRKFLKILSADQMDQLQYLFSMLHTDNKYYVCNQDEIYAPDVLSLILEGETEKLLNDGPV